MPSFSARLQMPLQPARSCESCRPCPRGPQQLQAQATLHSVTLVAQVLPARVWLVPPAQAWVLAPHVLGPPVVPLKCNPTPTPPCCGLRSRGGSGSTCSWTSATRAMSTGRCWRENWHRWGLLGWEGLQGGQKTLTGSIHNAFTMLRVAGQN
jgi:hypothetical protein